MTDAGRPDATRVLDAVVTRVRAANPSPMTLTGTNTYLLSSSDDATVVVDPGPDDADHRAHVDAALARTAPAAAVVVTHHHPDHADAVGWAAEWGVPAYAFDPERIPGTRRLGDDDHVPVDGVEVTVHHLPGHTADHLCLRVGATGAVLTGDLILGEGTSVIAWPDGDLDEFLASLERLRSLAPSVLYPGHGEPVDDPGTRIADLAAHRADRTAQILDALAAGCGSVDEIVSRVYPELAPALRGPAGRSVTAHLVSLERRGRVTRAGDRWHGA